MATKTDDLAIPAFLKGSAKPKAPTKPVALTNMTTASDASKKIVEKKAAKTDADTMLNQSNIVRPAAAKKAAPKAKIAAKPKAKIKAKAKAKPKSKPKAKAKKVAAPKKDSLVDKLIALMSSAKGCTNEEAFKALGFKTAQSVRGTINGPVKKRHKVVVEKDDKRGNVYRIKK